MSKHIVRFLSGGALVAGTLVGGVVACEPASARDEVAGEQVDELEGAGVVLGATGVVEYVATFPNGKAGGCTGTMIDKNAIVTAAHCFGEGGSGSNAWTGIASFQIFYHDPKSGRRPVYSGPATWVSYPTYDSSQQGDAGAADSDMALIVTPVPLEPTDYHDYIRIYTDIEGPIEGSLTAFGAGIFNDSGADDLQLRKSVYVVKDVTGNHVVVDQSDSVHVCHGDSGGPLVKYGTQAGVSISMLVGDLAQTEGLNVPVPLPGGGGIILGGGSCYSPIWNRDDAFYSRINFAKISWIESHTGVGCTAHVGNLHYKRCFPVPFINDVIGEGGLERRLATALFTVASL